MSFSPTTGDRLLSAWLSLTSTLWNKRLVSDLTYNEAHVMGILLRKKSSGRAMHRDHAHSIHPSAQEPDEQAPDHAGKQGLYHPYPQQRG